MTKLHGLLVVMVVGCAGERERAVMSLDVEHVHLEMARGSLMVQTHPDRAQAVAVLRGAGAVDGPELVIEERGGEAWITVRCGVDPSCEGDVDLDLPAGVSLSAELSNGNLATFSLVGGEHDYTVEKGIVAASFAEPPARLDVLVGRGEAQVDLPAGDYGLSLDAPDGDVAVARQIGTGDGPAIAVVVERGDVTVGAMPER
jgi:hypothetical protein